MKKEEQKKAVYFNRELSWIEFNGRVLDEGMQKDVPLLERLKFLSIVSSNFDEFFMVRVAGLKALLAKRKSEKDVSGMTAAAQIEAISKRVHELTDIQYSVLIDEILPALEKAGIKYVKAEEYSKEQAAFLSAYFDRNVFPLLTPIRADSPAFIHGIINLRLHVAFALSANDTGGGSGEEGEKRIAVVQVPSGLESVIEIPGEGEGAFFTLIDDVVLAFGYRLFPGFSADESMLFKITRDADRSVDEARDSDFIAAMEEVITARHLSQPVRLLCSGGSKRLLEFIRQSAGLSENDVYLARGPLEISALAGVARFSGAEELRDPPWRHYPSADFPADEPVWDVIKAKDVLLHVPYQSYDPVIRFITEAAEDPDVLAVKITLYRTSRDSPIIKALERAAALGKQVTVFVELKARFDEEQNIAWVRKLTEAGIIVVYGIEGLKVHAKVLQVIRREPDTVRSYAHLATGNYNDKTAALYSDMSIFTADRELNSDITLFFNMISGYSAVLPMSRLVVSPVSMKTRLLSLIAREVERSGGGNQGHIIAKMNSLADPDIIDALYKASQAGVKIDLNIRGICMLVPGVAGLSENITVVSVIDRYLEHTRIFWFENGRQGELYLSSADWMPRNLERRVEAMFPVLQENLKKEILEMLMLYFADNTKAHVLDSTGAWRRKQRKPREKRVRAQAALQEREEKHFSLMESRNRRDLKVRRGGSELRTESLESWGWARSGCTGASKELLAEP